jgi:hypothetical protein
VFVEEGIIAEGVKRDSLLTNCVMIPKRDQVRWKALGVIEMRGTKEDQKNNPCDVEQKAAGTLVQG